MRNRILALAVLFLAACGLEIPPEQLTQAIVPDAGMPTSGPLPTAGSCIRQPWISFADGTLAPAGPYSQAMFFNACGGYFCVPWDLEKCMPVQVHLAGFVDTACTQAIIGIPKYADATFLARWPTDPSREVKLATDKNIWVYRRAPSSYISSGFTTVRRIDVWGKCVPDSAGNSGDPSLAMYNYYLGALAAPPSDPPTTITTVYR